MFTKQFWKEAIERAVKTAAQAVILVWGVGEAATDAFSWDLAVGAGSAIAGFVISILTSLASAPFGEKGTPQL